jgi:hypothetical protein
MSRSPETLTAMEDASNACISTGVDVDTEMTELLVFFGDADSTEAVEAVGVEGMVSGPLVEAGSIFFGDADSTEAVEAVGVEGMVLGPLVEAESVFFGKTDSVEAGKAVSVEGMVSGSLVETNVDSESLVEHEAGPGLAEVLAFAVLIFSAIRNEAVNSSKSAFNRLNCCGIAALNGRPMLLIPWW